ncbi:beta-N-acetylhexosaminidase [Tissierella carlieri]|uniref:beta-N-acetylhexosaminidase n=1 Tax=Tissierella carlieri TaxID=689904 RepID=A0ABT1SCL7_9FIRM|nr:beta-N-acetylhexosaminidase [Tissierella carlieri]MCQ4924234.1 beta-N-acetylhexosaminidase [Tissierella carlieri]
MRLKVIIFILLISIIFIGGCKQDNLDLDEPDIEIPNNNNEEAVDSIGYKVKSMSLEEKIGQLMIVGFDGIDINEEIVRFIEDFKVGGFILFARNIVDESQTLKLLNDIKDANTNSDIPLFLSIDEEGGKVSRLPKSFAKLPEAMKIGKKNDKNISYRFGNILGQRVSALGFNMNFAPVLDINSNPKNPVIGSRAFGTTIDQVVNNGLEVMNGIRDIGVIPAVKHFPGHGDTDVDSHVKLPRVDKTIEELKSFELIPFIEAIKKNVDMVMVAHILYPKIDKEYPATMSSRIIEGVLREELNYDGVIVSDDMTMGAIVQNYTLEDGVLSFIKAGGDIALVCHGEDNPGKVFEKIKEAIETGEITQEDIDKKVYRILELKEKYKLEDKETGRISLKTLNNDTRELIEEINK